MTTYIAAYDTELPPCLESVRRIVKVHEKYEMPGTFFIVAGLLDQSGDEYRALLGDHPLFEIASHSYTHMMVTANRVFGQAGPEERFEREIVESKRRIEDVFGCEVTGFRTPVANGTGLCGATTALRLCDQAGYRYVSSCLWGPNDTLPAPVREAFTYADDGYPGLWEFPSVGWHENLLKEGDPNNPWVVLPFPSLLPEAMVSSLVKTPEEEFIVHRACIDKAVERKNGHASLVWHPWSLLRFDPEMKMLDLVFRHVRDLGLPATTFAAHTESV